MDSEIFNECLDKNKTSKSWNLIAEQNGFASGEVLRSAFRREKRRRENTPMDAETASSNDENEHSSYEEGNDFINVVCASKRMLNKDDIIKQFNIDLDVWEIEKFKVGTHEGYRKDRKVQWKVRDGSVVSGDVDDSGRMLVVPLYHIEVRLVKRQVPSIENVALDFQKFEASYKFPEIKYTKEEKDNLLEVSIYDLHYGKLAWGKESGEDYDSKIARERFLHCINHIITETKDKKFDKIIFPVGNDFFNSDTVSGTTTKGTPQDNDSRWAKMFYDGVHLLTEGIDLLSSVSPVEIFWIPGNHDKLSSYYATNYLAAWYRNSKNVNVDTSPSPRKYVEYGEVLIGFSHGGDDSKRIKDLMQVEARQAWGRTSVHEYHLGDLHHEIVNENGGLIVRRLSSVTSNDNWHSESGYVGAIHKAQAFVWNKKLGLMSIINSPV